MFLVSFSSVSLHLWWIKLSIIHIDIWTCIYMPLCHFYLISIVINSVLCHLANSYQVPNCRRNKSCYSDIRIRWFPETLWPANRLREHFSVSKQIVQAHRLLALLVLVVRQAPSTRTYIIAAEIVTLARSFRTQMTSRAYARRSERSAEFGWHGAVIPVWSVVTTATRRWPVDQQRSRVWAMAW